MLIYQRDENTHSFGRKIHESSFYIALERSHALAAAIATTLMHNEIAQLFSKQICNSLLLLNLIGKNKMTKLSICEDGTCFK